MTKKILVFLFLSLMLPITKTKAQIISDDGILYIQNFTFSTNASYRSPKVQIGNNVYSKLPKGNVIVSSGSNLSINLGSIRLTEFLIQPGLEIKSNSRFTLDIEIPVGTGTEIDPLFNPILAYNHANTSFLNLAPLYFADFSTKISMWGIEEYTDGLNFWRPNHANYNMFIASNGNIGIGATPSYKLDVKGDIATSGVYLTTSDIRLKSDIEPLTNCPSNIEKLKGKSYLKKVNNTIIDNTIDNEEKVERQLGLIAQDVIEIYPELVTKDSTGLYSLDYLGFIPIMAETIKEQKQKIDDNSEKIRKLKEYIKHTFNLNISSN